MHVQVTMIMYFSEVVLNHKQFLNCLDILYASLYTNVDVPGKNATQTDGNIYVGGYKGIVEVDVKPASAQLCVFCMCALNRYVAVRGTQGSVVHEGVKKDDVSRSFSILADRRYAVYTKSQTDYKDNHLAIKNTTHAQLVYVSDKSQS